MIDSEAVLGLPGYEVISIDRNGGEVTISARYTGPISCPHCAGTGLRSKGRYVGVVRHESMGTRRCWLAVEAHKFQCRGCGRGFRQRFPGVLPRARASEPLRREVFLDHWDGVSRSRISQRQRIGSATVERWFQHCLRRVVAERSDAVCPRVLGIDEHFFSRRKGFATTFCNLENHTVYDVVAGRSEAALEPYLRNLKGKQEVRVVCMDLSSTYRALVRKHFPHARIVADRFHVIRLVLQQFLACWKTLDPVGAKNRGLLSLLRRHRRNLKPDQRRRVRDYFARNPAIEAVWRVKETLSWILLRKHRTKRQCARLVPRFLRILEQLRACPFAPLATLGDTLHNWAEQIVPMWRFTRNNGITEGFHTRIEVLQRQAYGFRNFANYRMRVRAMCSRAVPRF